MKPEKKFQRIQQKLLDAIRQVQRQAERLMAEGYRDPLTERALVDQIMAGLMEKARLAQLQFGELLFEVGGLPPTRKNKVLAHKILVMGMGLERMKNGHPPPALYDDADK